MKNNLMKTFFLILLFGSCSSPKPGYTLIGSENVKVWQEDLTMERVLLVSDSLHRIEIDKLLEEIDSLKRVITKGR